MKLSRLLLASIVCAPLIAACRGGLDDDAKLLAGVTTKNGGDTVNCKPDAELKASSPHYFEGDWNLDYLLTYDPNAVEPQLASWEAYRDRLQLLLDAKLPPAGKSFRQFAELIESTDPTKPFIWQPSVLDLTNLADEHLEQVLPRNCYDGNGDTKTLRINQLIVRGELLAHPDQVYYSYDLERLKTLRATLPLQFAFLMTHEWLWTLTKDSWVNRTFNRLLYSSAIDAMTSEQLREYFAKLDVQLSDSGFLHKNGPRDVELEQAFKSKLACDASRIAIKDFAPAGKALTLAAGEERVLELKLADDDALAGKSLCGFAVSLEFDFPGATAQSFDIELWRTTQATFKKNIVVTDSRQEFFTAHCNAAALCTVPTGELKSLVVSNAYPKGTWRLKIKNASASAKLEINRPILMLVKAKGS